MMLVVTWVVHVAEYLAGGEWGCGRREYPPMLHTVYWALTTMTTVGYGDVVATSPLGRALACVWSVAGYLALSTLTSVVTSLLTASALSSHTIDSMADITGTMCVEEGYPLMTQYVARSAEAPTSIFYASIAQCMEALLSGRAEAVLAERPILVWYLSAYAMPSLYLSPLLHPNPLAFVYSNGSSLRSYVNPAVIAAQTNPLWVAEMDSITTIYFGAPQRVHSVVPAVPMNHKLEIAAGVLAALTVVAHFAQSRGWVAAAAAPVLRRVAVLRRALPSWLQPGGGAGGAGGSTPQKSNSKLVAGGDERCTPEGRGDAPSAPATLHEGSSGQKDTGGAAPQRVAAALLLLAELRQLSATQAESARVNAERVDALESRIAALLEVDAAGASPGGQTRARGLRHASTAQAALANEQHLSGAQLDEMSV
jgi:hypothetical protein